MATLAPYADVHKQEVLRGVGDARPTALQIIEDQGLENKLEDKTILITGCTSGIGVETARALYKTGANIYITSRNVPKGKEIAESIATEKSRAVHVIPMSLDSFDSIRTGTTLFLEQSKTLNILINNAGVMACDFTQTAEGYESQFGTNHLGHFLLFHLLRPTLIASASPDFASRVVSVSSAGHRISPIHSEDYNLSNPDKDHPDHYDPWKAYGQSKLANILFANELERRYGSEHIHALSLHPGSIYSGLQKHAEARGDAIMSAYHTDPDMLRNRKSAEQGAATTVWAAVAKEWEGRGGRYLENVQESEPKQEGQPLYVGGYAKTVYDPPMEKRLWEDSLKMIGMPAGV